MKKYARSVLRIATVGLEYLISFLLVGGVILVLVQLLQSVGIAIGADKFDFNNLLSTCLDLVIGVEMIRMIHLQTPTTVFEVLLFAIGREIVLDSDNLLHSLIGVVAIAVLFAIRKFLFVNYDVSDKVTFNASQKLKNINRFFRVKIPYENDETLLDVLMKRLEEEDMEPEIGVCTDFQGFILHIVGMMNGEVTRIEVIRSIH